MWPPSLATSTSARGSRPKAPSTESPSPPGSSRSATDTPPTNHRRQPERATQWAHHYWRAVFIRSANHQHPLAALSVVSREHIGWHAKTSDVAKVAWSASVRPSCGNENRASRRIGRPEVETAAPTVRDCRSASRERADPVARSTSRPDPSSSWHPPQPAPVAPDGNDNLIWRHRGGDHSEGLRLHGAMTSSGLALLVLV